MMKNGLVSIVDKLMNDPSATPFLEQPQIITTEKNIEHAKRKLDFNSSCDKTCAVVVNDIRKHPWWGPKVRQLSGEAAAVIKPKILKKPPEPLIDFKKFLAKIESDAFSGVLDCHLELKSLINSAKHVGPAQKQALFDAYEAISREIFPWFDPNLPWKYFEESTSVPKIPYDDHRYISTKEVDDASFRPEARESPILKQKRYILDTGIRNIVFINVVIFQARHETLPILRPMWRPQPRSGRKAHPLPLLGLGTRELCPLVI